MQEKESLLKKYPVIPIIITFLLAWFFLESITFIKGKKTTLDFVFECENPGNQLVLKLQGNQIYFYKNKYETVFRVTSKTEESNYYFLKAKNSTSDITVIIFDTGSDRTATLVEADKKYQFNCK